MCWGGKARKQERGRRGEGRGKEERRIDLYLQLEETPERGS